MLYSCTHMATVSVKGLNRIYSYDGPSVEFCSVCLFSLRHLLHSYVVEMGTGKCVNFTIFHYSVAVAGWLLVFTRATLC